MSEAKTPTEPKEGLGGRVVLIVVLVLALLVGGGWYAAYSAAADKAPRGTTVSGVEIGGLSLTDAVAELRQELGTSGSIPISVEGRGAELDPADAGLAIDYQASVEQTGAERSWAPGRLWDYFTGGDDFDAVVEVDEAALSAAITELGVASGSTAKNASIKLTNGQPVIKDARAGTGLDPEASRDAVIDAFVSGGTAELELTQTQPEITDDDVQDVLDDFVNPALSAPVTLVFGDSPVRLTPAQYSGVIKLQPAGGVLEPQVRTKRLAALVESATAGSGAPVDATVRLVDGKPKVIPAKPGVTFDPATISDTFLDLVVRDEGRRELEVESEVDEPDFTTADARKLGIKTMVSEFQTMYPPAEYRNINIGRAAEIINGTILKPGETFSMNGILGERTIEKGFVSGGVISGGIFKEDVGGGISQMATTTFNAMFFAGLEDIEHKPHSLYISRYPEGREATVNWPDLDLKFRNNTDYGVLIYANVQPSTASAEGVVTVRMYSTKVWDIDTTKSDRYAYTSPGTRYVTEPNCQSSSGFSGFQVDVQRIFRRPGESEVVRTEDFHTVYNPGPVVICGPPPGAGGQQEG